MTRATIFGVSCPGKSLPNKTFKNTLEYASKLTRSTRMINVGLVAGILLLSAGDIAPNPGPFDLRHPNGNKGISICQWNIQRLTDMKFEQILQSLTIDNNASNKLDILILTETFGTYKVPDSFYQIPGYDLERLDKKGKIGGGIFVYINSKLLYKRRNDLESSEVEVFWTEVYPF